MSSELNIIRSTCRRVPFLCTSAASDQWSSIDICMKVGSRPLHINKWDLKGSRIVPTRIESNYQVFQSLFLSRSRTKARDSCKAESVVADNIWAFLRWRLWPGEKRVHCRVLFILIWDLANATTVRPLRRLVWSIAFVAMISCIWIMMISGVYCDSWSSSKDWLIKVLFIGMAI